MKNFLLRNWEYRILALILALLLFAYVQTTQTGSDNQMSNNDKVTQLTSNKTDKFSVPLSLTVNSNKYVVTGYPEKVSIRLTGPSALVTTTANTQNFKAYADLSKLGVGHHNVRIKQEGLNKELRYHFQPSTISVDIQTRKTVSYPVSVKYPAQNIATGYKGGTATTDVKRVKITGALDQIDRIKSVVAQLNVPRNTKKTLDSQAIIEAVDANDKTVNVVITPSTANVDLPIASGNSKDVPVKLQALGVTASSDHYSFSSNTKKVKVFGNDAQLKKVKQVIVEVDPSGVKTTAKKSVELDTKLNNVKGMQPDHITVKITKMNN